MADDSIRGIQDVQCILQSQSTQNPQIAFEFTYSDGEKQQVLCDMPKTEHGQSAYEYWLETIAQGEEKDYSISEWYNLVVKGADGQVGEQGNSTYIDLETVTDDNTGEVTYIFKKQVVDSNGTSLSNNELTRFSIPKPQVTPITIQTSQVENQTLVYFMVNGDVVNTVPIPWGKDGLSTYEIYKKYASASSLMSEKDWITTLMGGRLFTAFKISESTQTSSSRVYRFKYALGSSMEGAYSSDHVAAMADNYESNPSLYSSAIQWKDMGQISLPMINITSAAYDNQNQQLKFYQSGGDPIVVNMSLNGAGGTASAVEVTSMPNTQGQNIQYSLLASDGTNVYTLDYASTDGSNTTYGPLTVSQSTGSEKFSFNLRLAKLSKATLEETSFRPSTQSIENLTDNNQLYAAGRFSRSQDQIYMYLKFKDRPGEDHEIPILYRYDAARNSDASTVSSDFVDNNSIYSYIFEGSSRHVLIEDQNKLHNSIDSYTYTLPMIAQKESNNTASKENYFYSSVLFNGNDFIRFSGGGISNYVTEMSSVSVGEWDNLGVQSNPTTITSLGVDKIATTSGNQSICFSNAPVSSSGAFVLSLIDGGNNKVFAQFLNFDEVWNTKMNNKIIISDQDQTLAEGQILLLY